MQPRWHVVTLALVAACSESASTPTSPSPSASPELHGQPILLHGRAAAASVPLGPMTWHGGDIMVTNKTFAIYWGREWSDPTFAGDKITGMTSFFQGWGNSGYAGASIEYTGLNYTGQSDQVTAASTYLGSVIDPSPAPTAVPAPDVMALSVVSEACKIVGVPDPTTLYVVFATTRRGTAGYGGFHTFDSCKHHPILVSLILNLDGDADFDPQDNNITGHSEGLAAIANATAHELSETITDPRGNSWYAVNHMGENGDKCAGSENIISFPYVTFSNGSIWHVQGEWSNSAFDAGTGDPNGNFELGCIYGT